ncbi:ArdC family protein [Hyphomicrobium sp.]|jgi:antirestriction protein ArdC|uniref:ArdC family protein n=1 Tax=Hyphomicrobium sp. TaxID=82 RepID=UPI003565D302
MPNDLYAEITDKLVALMEADPQNPQLPWRRSGIPLTIPANATTHQPYNGINILSLWMAGEQHGFTTPLWATYRQWAAAGAHVRRGEKASLVIFYKEYETNPNPDDTDDNGKRRVARASHVFNAAQVDGFEVPAPTDKLNPIDRIAAVETFIANTGATIRISGDRAYYRPSTDEIVMPEEHLFTGTDTMTRSQAFYAVELHEGIHWSGALTRLNRQFGKRFGDDAYAFEELVAELGASFLCAELQITQAARPDHAHYLANWLHVLKNDKRALFHAAAKAAEAVTYLKSLQKQPGLLAAE